MRPCLRLLFGLLLSPTSLGTRFRSALDLASDRALESALESALARSARLSLALALKTLVHMSHAWQLALARPCVYSVLSALSLMSGCMCSGSWLSLGPAYTLCTSRRSARPCLAACSVLSLQSIVVHKSELLIHGFSDGSSHLAMEPRPYRSHTGMRMGDRRASTPVSHGPRPLADDGGHHRTRTASTTITTTSSY